MLCNLEVRPVIYEPHILDIDKAKHVVGMLVILVDRDTCMHAAAEGFLNLLVAGIGIDCIHVNSGNHNILGSCISEIKYLMDQLHLVSLYGTVLMRDIYISLKFLLSDD